MKKNIRVSVCIPSYNKHETIEYTILSVLNQSFRCFELLIIDDSNNNYTEEVVSKFSLYDSRVRYIKNKERLGMIKNWNECIKQASFEYIIILHHDDFLMPGVLQAYNDFVEANPACGLIHSNCYYITLPYFKKSIGITQDKTIIEKGDEAIEKILFNNNLASSSIMVKKECYDKLGLFDLKAGVSPDWEMWARIGKYYDFGHLNIIGCTYILDNNNTHFSGSDVNVFYLQQQYNYKKIISYFSENFLKDNPYIGIKSELNLRNTIRGLAISYANILKFKTAKSYFIKAKKYKRINFLYIVIKAILKNMFTVVFSNKKSYKQVFDLTYPK
jgi:glycosyltransferase involved in cell wall biosynthesis